MKCPEMMSRDARYIISRLIEVDTRKIFRACDLMKEKWIQCNDLPLSVFETAGVIFRANSVDGRIPASRAHSKADGFNRNITKIHVQAVENLRTMGFSQRAIDESMKGSGNG